mgnify:CR=1 FL=1
MFFDCCTHKLATDAPRQGERPRICCHQRRDTTAQLEGPTLLELAQRKEKRAFVLMGKCGKQSEMICGIAEKLRTLDKAVICL